MSKRSLITVAVTHTSFDGEMATEFDSFEWNGKFTYEKYVESQKMYYEQMMREGVSPIFNKVTVISKIDLDEEQKESKSKMSKKSLISFVATCRTLRGETRNYFDNVTWEGDFTYEKFKEFEEQMALKIKSERMDNRLNRIAIISKIDFDEESMK